MKQGDTDARDTLIKRNLRLVAHIAKKYSSSPSEADDIISVGTIGLIKAIDSYKPECGTRFATYAVRCLQNEILMYFRSQKKLALEVSINETIDTDRDGNPLTYTDVISTEDSFEEDVDRVMQSRQALRLVKSALSDRERTIIELRYGLCGKKPLPQREVATLLGISRSYVSRIEKGALDKLHKLMTS